MACHGTPLNHVRRIGYFMLIRECECKVIKIILNLARWRQSQLRTFTYVYGMLQCEVPRHALSGRPDLIGLTSYSLLKVGFHGRYLKAKHSLDQKILWNRARDTLRKQGC